MRESILSDFGAQRPRAIVLDDSATALKATARRLRKQGFEVVECRNVEAFEVAWQPGMFDVIVSDWDLSHDPDENGQQVLESVREREWDVPFVLVSGKLDEAEEREPVLAGLLRLGSARFIRRGDGGIAQACATAQELLERRDVAHTRIILALRREVAAGTTVATSSGNISAAEMLEDIVSDPKKSRAVGRPIAKARAARASKRHE